MRTVPLRVFSYQVYLITVIIDDMDKGITFETHYIVNSTRSEVVTAFVHFTNNFNFHVSPLFESDFTTANRQRDDSLSVNIAELFTALLITFIKNDSHILFVVAGIVVATVAFHLANVTIQSTLFSVLLDECNAEKLSPVRFDHLGDCLRNCISSNNFVIYSSHFVTLSLFVWGHFGPFE
ncbi:hypothetical protein 16Q_142c [Pseudomonas phage 16Q]|nr:hypothetical protein 16Q_142c [Pseudomonas phage 16Q]